MLAVGQADQSALASEPAHELSCGMAKNVDRVRARAAVATIRENPFLVGVVMVPVLVVAGVVWWLTNWFVALVVLVVLGAVVLVRGRIVR